VADRLAARGNIATDRRLLDADSSAALPGGSTKTSSGREAGAVTKVTTRVDRPGYLRADRVVSRQNWNNTYRRNMHAGPSTIVMNSIASNLIAHFRPASCQLAGGRNPDSAYAARIRKK